MADETPPPDRLSNNPRSPHFDVDALRRGVGIRFKGREREDVEEYCASEGWIRVAAGKAVDRHGLPITVKLNGESKPGGATTAIAARNDPGAARPAGG